MVQSYNIPAAIGDIDKYLKESSITINTFFRELSATSDNLTAGTPQTQAGATALDFGLNRVTSASANNGVRLPFAAAGAEAIIRNAGGATIKIWPHSGGKIDSGSTNAADANTLATSKARIYRAISSTDWVTVGNS